ncbi:MAG TPA: endolytic transglycosylase MltG [Acidimicrobiia bacterium]|nr:endolytic transglycosylase MltG [Acidimicrobiia bacterium]
MADPDPETATKRSYRKPLAIGAAAIAGVFAMVLAAEILAAVVGGSGSLDVDPGIPVTVEIQAGSTARQIAESMERAGVVRANDLQSVVNDQGVASQLQAGRYNLETVMTPEAVVKRLLTGPDEGTGSSVIVHEGQDVRRIIAGLAEQTGYPVVAFEEALTSGAVTSSLMPQTFPAEVDPLTRWEGLLFPARYELSETATPVDMLTMMAQETVRRVDEVDWSRLGELGVTRYEALIVASLIQREAGVDEDRPLIVSVIYNRLEQDMPLQIDATVVYALGESPGRILAEHLEIESPWNTYRIKGLPPTPIGSAQMESIEAAANPAQTDYLFYVLVSPDGRHGFSRTYEEHKAKIAQAKADGVLP